MTYKGFNTLAEEAGTAEEEIIHNPKTLETLETRTSTRFQPTCLI